MEAKQPPAAEPQLNPLEALARLIKRRYKEAFSNPNNQEEASSWPHVYYWAFVVISHLFYLAMAIVETNYGPNDSKMTPMSHVITSSGIAGLGLIGVMWTIHAMPEVKKGTTLQPVALPSELDKRFVLHAYHVRMTYFLSVMLLGAMAAINLGLYYDFYGNTKPSDVPGGALAVMLATNRWERVFAMVQTTGFSFIVVLALSLAAHFSSVQKLIRLPSL